MQNNKKRKLGQYFTQNSIWLRPQIIDFIRKSGCTIAYDPFAGNGDLLKISNEYGIKKIKGLDIDSRLSWEVNDSLHNIPHLNNAIIITNPPYLTKYSASRKHIKIKKEYFDNHTDLYQLAIDKMLEAQDFVVAIVPETYINSNYFEINLERVNCITVLTDNPFNDTETPVCVVCFDNIRKKTPKIKVYLDDSYLNTYSYYDSLRLTPKYNYNIRFNDSSGKLALRAVDLTSEDKKISFLLKKDLEYDYSKIRVSSRLITVIYVGCKKINYSDLALECNRILNDYRLKTNDITLSPFKGNAKDGKRRRRLDYKTARCIIELAVENLTNNAKADKKAVNM